MIQIEPSPTAATEPTSQNSPGAQRGRVLLVVSDSMLHLNLASRLRLAGFEVTVASGGELAKCKLHSFNPEAVVLDLMVDDDNGDEAVKALRRDPEGAAVPILAFSSSPGSRAVKRAAKAGATELFTESTTPLDDIVADLTQRFDAQHSERESGTEQRSRLPETEATRAALRDAVGRAARHLVVLQQARTNQSRAVAYGELRGKFSPALELARQSPRPGLYRLASALYSLLKVLHEMPECATESTKHTVCSAIDVLERFCDAPADEAPAGSLELSAVVADNDMVSRSVVCSALRSVGFKFECFAHASVVLRYFDNNEADLVIVHLASDASTDPDFTNKLRAKSKHARTPVIVVSGISDFEVRSRIAITGLDEVITKPFIFMELSVKALTLALKKHLPAKQPVAGEAPQSTPPTESDTEIQIDAETPGLANFAAELGSDPADVQPPKLPRSRFKGSVISAATDAQFSPGELAQLRAELEKKQQEREILVSRIFNNELELDQIRTALDEEREHRQQLEQMVQDLMVGQPPTTPLTASPSDAAPEVPADVLASLQAQLSALSAESESLRAALEAKQQERQTLTTRIYNDELELESIRAQLDEERKLREQLEKTAPTASGTPDHVDEVARLRVAQEDLMKQLAAAQAESESEFRRKAELEVRLNELALELQQAETARRSLGEEHQRMQAELAARISEANATMTDADTLKAELTRREAQRDQELEALRQQQAKLEASLAAERETAAAGAQLKADLERELAEAKQKLDALATERQQAASEYRQTAATLEAELQQLKLTATQSTDALRAEVDRKTALQQELDDLWKTQDELDRQLSAEKKNAAAVRTEKRELEVRLHDATTQIEASRAAIRQAEEQVRQEAHRRESLETQLAAIQAELDGKLASQTQLAVEVGVQKADLEQRLHKLEEELPLARQKIGELSAERDRVRSELTEQLAAATRAASTAEEKFRAEGVRNQELQGQMESLRASVQEVEQRWQTELQRAQAATSAQTELRQQLDASRSLLERAESSRQQLVAEHKKLEAELAAQLDQLRRDAALVTEKLANESNHAQRLTDELARAQTRQQTLEGRLEGESKRAAKAETVRTALEGKLVLADKELAQARASIESLGQEKHHIETKFTNQLKAATDAAAAARQEVETSTRTNEDLRTQLAGLRRQQDDLQATLKNEQQAHVNARERGDRLETRIAEAQLACNELRDKLTLAEAAATEAAREKAALEDRLNAELMSWSQARTEFETRLAHHQRREADLSQELTAAETTAAQAQAAHQRELERANKFEQEVTQLWQVRDELKNQLAAGQKTLAELDQRRTELTVELEATRQQLSQATGEIASLRDAHARFEEQNRELSALNVTLRQDAALLAERQRAHEADLSSMDRRVRDSVASLARTTAELESERGERRRTEQRAAGLTAQLQELHRELNTHLEVEKENQVRIAEVERELATRREELSVERSAHETERGQRRDAEQKAAALTTQIESLQGELTERLRLERETQSRIANLEQQLRAREESLVRVTQHLETEREERRRTELRAEALIAQTAQLQDQLTQTTQRNLEHTNRIALLEEQGQARVAEILNLQTGLGTERGERRKVEERAQSLSVQLRDLHQELDRHLRTEKECQGRIAELEGQLVERQQAFARLQARFEKESGERELAEAQLHAAGDIAAKLQQYQASFADARKAFEHTQRELETRLEAAAETLREREELHAREAQEKSRLQRDLEQARRDRETLAQQGAIERSKLQSALQVESMERRRLEGEAMHSRYASLQSSRSGRTLVNGLRRQLERPVDELMTQARQLLALEMTADARQKAESLLASAVSLEASVRESDVVDLTAAEPAVVEPATGPANPAR